jgi:hypothetical protein
MSETKKRKLSEIKNSEYFCSLDYEHVRVVPSNDGLNNSRSRSTRKYKLRSIGEWINETCEDMNDFLSQIKANPKKSKSLGQDFRALLENAFSKSVKELLPEPKSISKNDQNDSSHLQQNESESEDEQNESED